MAFQDSWQQQRQLRLQQVARRRHAVSMLLQETHKQRQMNAAQLRSDLSLFRETLAYDESIRRRNLQQFCAALQAQTQDFLAIAQAERSLASQQLRHDLSTFRATLAETVQSLQQDIQADLQILQLETQTQLDAARQRRVKHSIQMSRQLQEFVEQLRLDVEAFLADAALERQENAAQAQRDRQAELGRLFRDFAELRSHLKQYRTELSRSVWVNRLQVAQPTVPLPVSQSAASPPLSQPALKKPEKRARGFKIAVAAKPGQAAPVQPSDDQRIYHYIEDMQSVRLTEIESALGMTRIQAVEGLRTLIQQGKVTQRDRAYLISN